MFQRKLTKIVGENFKIAKDNYYVNKNGERVDLHNTIQEMINNTEIIKDIEVNSPIDRDESYVVRDNIINIGTIDCILMLRKQGVKGNIIALDFANALNPGGGYLSGSRAQEESICRASLLFETLDRQKEFYKYNRENYTPLHTDMMIYTHNVPIIRDDKYDYLDNYELASFIVSPAVNRRISIFKGYNDNQIYKVMDTRIQKILTLSVGKKPSIIILGAYGCGVFGNDREVIFDIFEKHINRIVPTDIKIVFAVIK